jgi:single-strand DNA-binding protein
VLAPEVIEEMTRRAKARSDDPGRVAEVLNEVVLRGRVRHQPERRELPSGSVLVTLRLVVPRTTPGPGRATSDWVDCTVWQPALHGRLAGWRAGDQVEVRGALRRRFYRAAGATGTRLEVEVLGGRMLRRSKDPTV